MTFYFKKKSNGSSFNTQTQKKRPTESGKPPILIVSTPLFNVNNDNSAIAFVFAERLNSISQRFRFDSLFLDAESRG